jgi:hypothetical protein
MQGVRTLNTRNGKKQIAAIHHDTNISTSSQKKPLKASLPKPEPMLILKVKKKITCYINLLFGYITSVTHANYNLNGTWHYSTGHWLGSHLRTS